MKTALLLTVLFGAWFWQRPAGTRDVQAWPAGMPAFAGPQPVNFASTFQGGTEFVNLVLQRPAEQVLEDARRAYAEAGWTESPVRARDMLLFTRGEAVAAILAESTPQGTRVTAIQRPRGLGL